MLFLAIYKLVSQHIASSLHNIINKPINSYCENNILQVHNVLLLFVLCFSSNLSFISLCYQISRVQNVQLYKLYEAYKERMVKELRGEGLPEELRLWRGTGGDTVTKICKNGFDRSFAGKNGETTIVICQPDNSLFFIMKLDCDEYISTLCP